MSEEQKSWVEKKGHSRSKRKASGHGSLSKAGRTRFNEPVVWELHTRRTIYSKLPKKNLKKSKIPRMSNRRRYEKRELLNRKSGQNYRDGNL